MHHDCSTGPVQRAKYGRNSGDEQHKMATIVSQVAAVDEWDREHGGCPRPDQWYIDEGWSGFTMERPALERLRDDARDPARTWNELLVYDTSRLSREPGHRLYILEPEFEELGIKVIYIASPMYPGTADGRAMAGIQGVFDKWYAEKSRETMRRGLRDRVRRGDCWWAPYGYEVVRTLDPKTGRPIFTIEIVEHEARVVREIYAAVLDSQSTTQIARDLNTRGVPTRKKALWSSTQIADILHDPYYTGVAGFGKRTSVLPQKRRPDLPTMRRRPKSSARRRPESEWMGKAEVPAIIGRESQERAKAMLASNKRRLAQQTNHTYALRGLLRCALPDPASGEPCRHSLCAHTRTKPNGHQQSYYRCNRKYMGARSGERKQCRNHLPGPATDELVWEAVIGALQRTDDLRAAFERLQESPRRREWQQWEAAIGRLTADRDRLRKSLRTQQRLYEEGRYTDLEYEVARGDTLPQLVRVEESLEHAQRQLAAARTPTVDFPTIERLCTAIAQRTVLASPEDRAAVLAALLTRIDVYADRLHIQGALGDLTLRLSGGTRYQVVTAPGRGSPRPGTG